MVGNKSPIFIPNAEPILKETYGIIVYQEQVIRIANQLAVYHLLMRICFARQWVKRC
ncbi:MAG: hypothetical protein IPG53_13235 [Ignavibacteriales bacterium]|nr:hypothetical protein [Ignavibacteriales bacterium]